MVEIGIHTSYLVCTYLGGGVQADTYVARMAWCGVLRVVGVSPYTGIRMGGIGWNFGGPLIGLAEVWRASD